MVIHRKGLSVRGVQSLLGKRGFEQQAVEKD
jgi:hypothetical protein